MKTIKKIGTIGVLFLVLCGCASNNKKTSLADRVDLSIPYEEIKGQYTYKRLIVFDFDQMNDLLVKKVNNYQGSGHVQELKEATMSLLSRPDTDGVVAKLISVVRNPLEDENQWESTLIQLVRMSIDGVKNNNIGAAEQVTYGVILENILSEVKPAYIKQYKTGGLETDLVEYIAEKNPEYSKKAIQDRALGIMKNTPAPGIIARHLVKSKEDYLDKSKDKKEEAEESESPVNRTEGAAVQQKQQENKK